MEFFEEKGREIEKNKQKYNFILKDKIEKTYLKEYNKYPNVVLCCYTINTLFKIPFVQFILIKNIFSQIFEMPILKNSNKDEIEKYLSNILNSDIMNIEFDGYYDYDNKLYMCFDISKTNIEILVNDVYFDNNIKLVLLYELIVERKYCNVQIYENVIDFFINNLEIMKIENENKETCEIPIVGYVGKPTQQKINFTLIFGESPKDKLSIMGPFYYFTNFNGAIRQGGWSKDYKDEYLYGKCITDENSEGKYKKGGIVRFALFVGKIKYIENMPNDNIDNSSIKKEKLNSDNDDLKERLSIRITDYDGEWSKKYDSVYLSNIELDDGNIYDELLTFVLKDYEQQCPLSYHYINKSFLENKFDNIKNYQVL